MSSFETDDGCKIFFRLDGAEGAPVVMLSNSLGTDMSMWDPQMASLTRNFRVLRYDSRGHGRSGSPSGAYSMDRLGQDAVALLDYLALECVHFCGLSKGGMVGQWLGVRAPERIKRLVLANTSAYMGPPSNWQARIEGVLQQGMTLVADASLTRWFTAEFIDRAPKAITPVRDTLLACDVGGYSGCCAAIRDMDMRPTAKLIAPPTLVIAGAQDPSTSVEDGQWLVDQIKDGRLCVLDAAHLSNVECPEAFSAAILDFFSEKRV